MTLAQIRLTLFPQNPLYLKANFSVRISNRNRTGGLLNKRTTKQQNR